MDFTGNALNFYLELEDKANPVLTNFGKSYDGFVRKFKTMSNDFKRVVKKDFGSIGDSINKALGNDSTSSKATRPSPSGSPSIRDFGKELINTLKNIRIELAPTVPDLKQSSKFDTTNLRQRYKQELQPTNYIGKLTPFAEGGIVKKPTMALIGEAGDEAVIPLDKFPDIMQKMSADLTANFDKKQLQEIGKLIDSEMEKQKIQYKLTVPSGLMSGGKFVSPKDFVKNITSKINAEFSKTNKTEKGLTDSLANVSKGVKDVAKEQDLLNLSSDDMTKIDAQIMRAFTQKAIQLNRLGRVQGLNTKAINAQIRTTKEFIAVQEVAQKSMSETGDAVVGSVQKFEMLKESVMSSVNGLTGLLVPAITATAFTLSALAEDTVHDLHKSFRGSEKDFQRFVDTGLGAMTDLGVGFEDTMLIVKKASKFKLGDPKEMKDFITVASKMSQVFEIGAEDSSEFVRKMHKLGITSEDTGKILSGIISVSKDADVSMQELTEGVSGSIEMFKRMKSQGIENVDSKIVGFASAIGSVSDAFGSTAEAVDMMDVMTDPTRFEESSRIFSAMGKNLGVLPSDLRELAKQDPSQMFSKLAESVQKIDPKVFEDLMNASGNDQHFKNVVGLSKEQAQAFRNMGKSGVANFDLIRSNSQKAFEEGQLLDKMFADWQKTFGGFITRLKNTFLPVFIQLGTPMLQLVRIAFEPLLFVVKMASKLFTAMPKPIKFLASAFFLLTTANIGLTVAMKLLGATSIKNLALMGATKVATVASTVAVSAKAVALGTLATATSVWSGLLATGSTIMGLFSGTTTLATIGTAILTKATALFGVTFATAIWPVTLGALVITAFIATGYALYRMFTSGNKTIRNWGIALGIIMLPVGLLVASFIFLKNAFKGLMQGFSEGWKVVKKQLAPAFSELGMAWDEMKASLSTLIKPFADLFKMIFKSTDKAGESADTWQIVIDVFAFLGKTIARVIGGTLKIAVAIITNLIKGVSTLFQVMTDPIAYFQKNFESFPDFLSKVGGGIYDALTFPFRMFVNFIGDIMGVDKLSKQLVDPILGMFKGLWDSIKAMFGSGGDFMASVGGSLLGMIKGFLNKYLVTKVNGMIEAINYATSYLGVPAIGTMTAFGDGGLIDKPTVALMGEEGEREIVAPEKDFKAYTDGLVGQDRGKNSQVSMPPVNVNVDNSSSDKIFAEILSVLKAILNSSGKDKGGVNQVLNTYLAGNL